MKIKTVAYYPLHYGTEYLQASIKSILPCVDFIYFLYTDKPSYGFSAPVTCPENITEIAYEIRTACGNFPYEIIRMGACTNEGQHRESIWELVRNNPVTKNFHLILAVDADEVHETKILANALHTAFHHRNGVRVPMSGFINFWKSFNRACYDHFTPIRIYKLNTPDNTTAESAPVEGRVYHFSCAQKDSIMRYKYEIHGHKNELRPNWLEQVYFGWKEGDKCLHPVSMDIWGEALPFDKNTLPEVLKKHPNFNKEVIS